MADVANSPRVRIIEKDIGATALGKRLKYYIIATPEQHRQPRCRARRRGLLARRHHRRHLDRGSAHAGPHAARVRVDHGDAARQRAGGGRGDQPPALRDGGAHGLRQPASACSNLTLFLDPARTRTAATLTALHGVGLRPNRDFGTRNQPENRLLHPAINKYPGVFFIDAHQQPGSYFFPPNEDPVHHEISQFALDFIQNGSARRSSRSSTIRASTTATTNSTTCSRRVRRHRAGAADGRGGHDLREGPTATSTAARSTTTTWRSTPRSTSRRDNKVQLLDGLGRAVAGGDPAGRATASCRRTSWSARCTRRSSTQQPTGHVCGYFYKPGQHSGDIARLMRELHAADGVQRVPARHATVAGRRALVRPGELGRRRRCPPGTLWIPMEQGQKHWIQASSARTRSSRTRTTTTSCTWSYPLMRGLAGNGFLTKQHAAGVTMTEITRRAAADRPGSGSPVYAFNTDSVQASACRSTC